MATRAILLEFNELTPALLERFIAEERLPNFKRFYEDSLIYTTDAEESGERLNPWIQWVTVHSGLSFADHGVFRLDEGHKLEKPRVWDVLSAQGKRVWICGSMNVGYDLPLNGSVLPDPWTVTVKPHPRGLEPYFRFVQAQVQEHTSERMPLGKADYVRFLKFMISHGLSAATTSAIVKQLASEWRGGGRWKRAVILDKLQFDVFRYIYEKTEPDFSTFFLNSTAHMQHAYWREMDPEPFKVKPSDEDRTEHGEAVLFGYMQMDRLLRRFMTLAGQDVTLVFCTGLSQQPCLTYEETGGKRFYRPRDFKDVTTFAGIRSTHACSPVMSEQFRISFDDSEAADKAEPKIRALMVNGRPLMLVRRDSPNRVFTGAAIHDEVPNDAVLTNEAGEEVRFYDLFYRADMVKSGMHHPDGALWIRTPKREHRVFGEKVSLRAVAPTIARMFGVQPPPHMQAEPVEWEVERVGV